jgi:sensor histidine kinase YesM
MPRQGETAFGQPSAGIGPAGAAGLGQTITFVTLPYPSGESFPGPQTFSLPMLTTMLTTKETPGLAGGTMPGKKIVNRAVFIAALVLLYAVALFYTNTVMMEDQEITALGVTLYVLGGVYLGQYLSQAWRFHYQVVPAWVFVMLLAIITASAVWLFVYLGSLLSILLVNGLLVAFPLLTLSVATGMLIKLTRTSIAHQLQAEKARAAQSRSELNLLQSQLSPHFLFNTLNNLYGISITQPDKVPPLLLKLSDLLRYSVYDVKELLVPLKSEIAYLRNYIEFEKLRIGEKLTLQADIEDVADEKVLIAPMLLIVFLENAFKHAKNTTEEQIFIAVSLKTWGDSILFAVRNSHGYGSAESTISPKDSGLGLVNVRKRLELLYDNAHELDIRSEASVYSVRLQLRARKGELGNGY